MVAITAVTPSSSGRPAATSAPNASSRMTIVIGSEIVSAFLRSSSNIFETALPVLASPNCSMRSSGCAFWAAAVAARTGSTLSSACVGVALDLERHGDGVAVAGDLPGVLLGVGGLDVRDVLDGGEPLLDVLDGGAVAGALRALRLGLDEDLLTSRLREGVLDDLVGAGGVAGQALLVGGDRLGAEAAADQRGDDHEGEPAEDRLLAMLRAPATGSRGEVLLFHGGSLGRKRHAGIAHRPGPPSHGAYL